MSHAGRKLATSVCPALIMGKTWTRPHTLRAVNRRSDETEQGASRGLEKLEIKKEKERLGKRFKTLKSVTQKDHVGPPQKTSQKGTCHGKNSPTAGLGEGASAR